MIHCFWGYGINIIFGTMMLLNCDDDDTSTNFNPLMKVKDYCLSSNIYSFGAGEPEIGRFPIFTSYKKSLCAIRAF
uniref:Uncharacterized protein n=1 Tax=Meloidogyne enterolobii TaxID=390850 RepID=A0A6V7VYV7_MELEN|nr:unnamed protein product [Meloidogyne enterolobii]